MEPLSRIYKESFFSRRNSLEWRAEPVCNTVVNTFRLIPGKHSVLDMGCAIGEYVKKFRNMGIRAMGFEGCPNVTPYIYPEIHTSVSIYDLRKFDPTFFKVRYEVCMCLEVAEHIEKEYAVTFIKNLVHASDRVLISAAPPGQKGHHHVNCQEPGYWELLFKIYGYVRSPGKERRFRSNLEGWKHRKEIASYYNNSMVFEKES